MIASYNAMHLGTDWTTTLILLVGIWVLGYCFKGAK